MLRLLSKGARLAYGVKYSRFYLEDLARDREAEQRALDEIKENQRLQSIRNLPANDSNPNNRVAVKMNHSVFGINPKKDYLKESCWVLEPKPINLVPQKTISVKRKYIITSIKKAKQSLLCIKKRHIFDAIHQLEMSQKKVPKLLIRTFYNLLDHAKARGFSILKLWVHGCIIGKTKRYRGLRYHAKGRGNREKRDFCQVKIIFYEKPDSQFFEEIAEGKCAPGVANFVRFALKDYEDYGMLTKFTGVTTSRGRQQAKMIFKRKIDKIMIENEEQNKYEPRKVIEDRLRKEEGVKMQDKFQSLYQQDLTSLKTRERLYKKNMDE